MSLEKISEPSSSSFDASSEPSSPQLPRSFRAFAECTLQEVVERLVARHESLLSQPHVEEELEAERRQRLAAEETLRNLEKEVVMLRSEKGSLQESKARPVIIESESESLIEADSDEMSNPDSSPEKAPASGRSSVVSNGQERISWGSSGEVGKAKKPATRTLAAPAPRNEKRAKTLGAVNPIPEESTAPMPISLPIPAAAAKLHRQMSDGPSSPPSPSSRSNGIPSAAYLKTRRKSAPTLAPPPEHAVVKNEWATNFKFDPPMPEMKRKLSISQQSVSSSQSNTASSAPAPTRGSSFTSCLMRRRPSIQGGGESILGCSEGVFESVLGSGASEFGASPSGLYSSESTTFSPLDIWSRRDDGEGSKALGLSKLYTNSLSSVHHIQPFDPFDLAQLDKCQNLIMERCVVTLDSWKRLFWDILSVLVICLDAVLIPWQFVRFPQTLLKLTASWFARIFWTLDMPACFLTAFALKDGRIEKRPKKIASHYRNTWLIPDATMLIIDWIAAISASEGDEIDVLVCVRLLRMLRLTRLQTLIDVAMERTRSEKIPILASMVKSVFGIIFFTHMLACCWVGVGRGREGWISHYGISENDRWVQYAMSFHYVLAQLHGTADVDPSTLGERFLAITILLAGFILATIFVSSITSSMTRLQIMSSQQASQFKQLHRYLQDNGISRNLTARVQLNAMHALEEQQKYVLEENVELLQHVSEALLADLHAERFSPTLTMHPIFQHLQDIDPETMREICHTAVSFQTLSTGDVLFRPGEVPTTPMMIFVVSGELVYSQDGKLFERVQATEWICEPVLWTAWMYHGLCYVEGDCQAVFLNAERFRQSIKKFQKQKSFMRYAAEFVKLLNSTASTRSDLGSRMDIRTLMVLAYPDERLLELPARHANRSWSRGSSGSKGSKASQLSSVKTAPLPIAFEDSPVLLH